MLEACAAAGPSVFRASRPGMPSPKESDGRGGSAGGRLPYAFGALVADLNALLQELDADEDRARVAGLTLGGVASQLQTSLEGTLGGTMIEDLEELPVRVRYREERRSDLASIASTNLVRAGSDRWVPLSALGDLELRPELAAMDEHEGLRPFRERFFGGLDYAIIARKL